MIINIIVWYIIPMLICHLIAYVSKKVNGEGNVDSQVIFFLSFIPLANIFGILVSGFLFAFELICKRVKIKMLIDYKNFIVGKK